MGPLSMHQDKEKFRALDTSEKRDNAGAFTTGKTARKHHKGAPVSEQNAPKNLARRLRAFDKAGDKTPTKFHRPGSNKK